MQVSVIFAQVQVVRDTMDSKKFYAVTPPALTDLSVPTIYLQCYKGKYTIK